MLKVQPACLKSSPPPGASITPSSEMNSVTTILPILILLRGGFRPVVTACLCPLPSRRTRRREIDSDISALLGVPPPPFTNAPLRRFQLTYNKPLQDPNSSW